MENLDMTKIANLTGRAIQDDETFKTEGGFVPERDQVYFEMRQRDNTFLLGFKDILLCMRLMEELGEIPEINHDWWGTISSLYGYDLMMVKLDAEEKN